MSVTLGAALKKIAVALFTDKKVLKKVCGIILGIGVVVVMPIVAVISIFNGNINLDSDRLQEMVIENFSEEDLAKLQTVDSTSTAIECQMTAAGFTADRIKEAQILYLLALSGKANEPDFVQKLVSCFAVEQTDEQCIAKINNTFGIELRAQDFSKVMKGIRAISIDTSGFIDITSKNNLDLVEWAKQAEKAKWGYVYGTYGTVLDKHLLEGKINQYPEEVGKHEKFIRQHYIGTRTVDCVGLIKGYAWLNVETKNMEIGSNGMPDISANGMFNTATEKGPIHTLPETPGLAVWQGGHIGIYIGNGEIIEAANTEAGVIKTKLSQGSWTHWLKIPSIQYLETEASL